VPPAPTPRIARLCSGQMPSRAVRRAQPEEAELEVVIDAIEAYEAVRWPEGKEPGGKG